MYKIIVIVSIALLTIFAAACGSGAGTGSTGKTIKSGGVGNLTVTIANPEGVLKKGKQDLTLTFADASGKPVDAGSASVNFFMPAMGSMAEMNDQAAFSTTKTPGVCKGKIEVQMAGEWQARVVYDGPAGRAETSFPVTVQ